MIKSFAFIAIICFVASVSDAFQTSTPSFSLRSSSSSPSSMQMIFGFGEQKDDGKPGDYLCKDCGYVFTKGPDAWAKLPDNYKCPPCGAPKFRFKKVPKGSVDGKVEVKKSWF
mmetsp:Transcript_6422/g.14255  ORF Transcript_6422/g.14255 Transcript_6422/m.14255 type:complete len:113 (-) Transcript_6422:1737-2075(-)|eukprot:g4091.t1 g4091   contig15:326562-327058(+)